MNPLLILGLGAAAIGVYLYSTSKSTGGVASAQSQANATYGPGALQQAAGYGMSAAQLADAQSLGLNPYESLDTLNATGLPSSAVLSTWSTSQQSVSGSFYDPLSATWYPAAP